MSEELTIEQHLERIKNLKSSPPKVPRSSEKVQKAWDKINSLDVIYITYYPNKQSSSPRARFKKTDVIAPSMADILNFIRQGKTLIVVDKQGNDVSEELYYRCIKYCSNFNEGRSDLYLKLIKESILN